MSEYKTMSDKEEIVWPSLEEFNDPRLFWSVRKIDSHDPFYGYTEVWYQSQIRQKCWYGSRRVAWGKIDTPIDKWRVMAAAQEAMREYRDRLAKQETAKKNSSYVRDYDREMR